MKRAMDAGEHSDIARMHASGGVAVLAKCQISFFVTTTVHGVNNVITPFFFSFTSFSKCSSLCQAWFLPFRFFSQLAAIQPQWTEP